MSAKKTRAVLLLDELLGLCSRRQGEDKVLEALSRRCLDDDVATGSRFRRRHGGWRRYRDRLQSPLEPIRQDMVAFGLLFRHQGFNGRREHRPIAGCTGSNEGDEEV